MQHIKNRAAPRTDPLAVPHRLLIVTQLQVNDLKPLNDVRINDLRRLIRG